MKKTAHESVKTSSLRTVSQSSQTSLNTPNEPLCVSDLSVGELERFAQDWLFDAEYRQQSPRTIEGKTDAVKKLLWFLRERGYTHCGLSELRQFLAYVGNGHKEKGGRWGNKHLTKPATPRTVDSYHVYLHGMFGFLVTEEVISTSPMERIPRPDKGAPGKSSRIQPFTQDQVQALLRAARRSRHPKRDEAILIFLLDTGIRASELCNLRMSDLDERRRSCTVRGKGDKERTIHIGRAASKALWRYFSETPRGQDGYVFLGDRGKSANEPLTRSGLLQLIHRLGAAAGIHSVRCSPHTFRHYFAVEFLRGGGNVFSLQQLLGHNDLDMTNRYVKLAQADLENQHRQFSPGDRLLFGRQTEN